MASRQSTSAPPAWFRDLVWNGLLASLAQLLPTPFVDDVIEGRFRRRLAERLAAAHGLSLTASQARRLAGEPGGWSLGRLAGKALLYPVQKIVRKVVYVLAIKKALDTFSDVFHRGYLLRTALELEALTGATATDARVEEVAAAIQGVLEATDTGPIGNAVRGVFRGSRRLVGKAVAWLGRRLIGRTDVDALETAGADAAALEREAPQTEELLDRLLLVLWGREDHLADLERALEAALGEPPDSVRPQPPPNSVAT